MDNKKRQREEENNSNDQSLDEIEDYDFDEANMGNINRVNLPRKSKYRMRAHCNPLSSISIP